MLVATIPLIDHFDSSAVKLDRLTALWTQVVLRLFPQPLRAQRQVRPGRRRHQDPQVRPQDAGGGQAPASAVRNSNTKPEFIMGHSLQAVSLLVQAASSFFAVPLAVRIHEGLVWSNRDRRTLLDKMLALLGIAAVEQPFYFVADAYYAAHKIVAGLLKQNNHLPTRMKSNAVAYTAYQQRGPRQARPPPGLWQQDQAQLPVASLQRLPTSPKPGLRREQGDHPVSGPRPAVASRRPAWCASSP